MKASVRLVSGHPLVVKYLSLVLERDPKLRGLLSIADSGSASPVSNRSVQIFLLDMCALPVELPTLCRTLRTQYPGCKCLALLSPEGDGDPQEMLRLLHMGVDGIVKMGVGHGKELRVALHQLLAGKLWAPPEILAEFVRDTNLLLETQLRPYASLTGRQNQVLQLMIRHLSNKEIADMLKVSERTAKFHVSGVLNKLGLENRRQLFESMRAAHG